MELQASDIDTFVTQNEDTGQWVAVAKFKFRGRDMSWGGIRDSEEEAEVLRERLVPYILNALEDGELDKYLERASG